MKHFCEENSPYLLRLILVYLVCLPLISLADSDIQARFERSLKNVKSLSKVEIEYLDVVSIRNTKVLKSLNMHGPEFSRTLQYTYLASGLKYRTSCKLISGTGTSLGYKTPFESVFDGKEYLTYTGDLLYLTKNSKNPRGGSGVSLYNPLIAPFMFLTGRSDSCMGCILGFTDIISLDVTNAIFRSIVKKSDGLIEISIPGRSIGNQTTTWKIAIDETGDSFTPRSITEVDPGSKTETVVSLLNYTNLGSYQFPSRIEWISSSYPPTSPPNVISEGIVTMVSASIPDQLTDSAFNFDSEENAAKTIWDWDRRAVLRLDPDLPKSQVKNRSARNILLMLMLFSIVIISIVALKRFGR